MNLKNALAGLSFINQFVVMKLTWDGEKARFKKLPINANNPLYPANAADSENWLTFDLCTQKVAELNAANTDSTFVYSRGFYLTENCGYWFLDLDNILIDGEWSLHASEIYALLKDCAFEYSSSCRGVHFIGRGQLPQNRAVKNSKFNIELYNNKRIITFNTQDTAQGCANTDMTEIMRDIICPKYFPSKIYSKETSVGNDDFSSPRIDWNGSLNDDELIIRMRRASTQNQFNLEKATFSDLFDNNREVLNHIYNSDASAMDFALAAHLAFWTGCDAPRMEKLMRESKLYRDKWDTHKTYLVEHTILPACRKQVHVLQDKQAPRVDANLAEPTLVDINKETFIADEANQLELFKNCVYVIDENCIYRRLANGDLQKLVADQFNAIYAQFLFKMNMRNDKSTYSKKAFDAFVASQLINFPKVDFCKFKPNLPPVVPFVEDGVRYLNSYSPTRIAKEEGDVHKFIELVNKILPNGNDATILMSWMSACVQYPGVKFRWSPVLQGGFGIGKTLITGCLSYAIGNKFAYSARAKDLGGHFNEWISGKLLIVVNEMYQGADYKEREGELKKLVSDDLITVEGKNKNQVQIENFANFIFTLNNKSDFKRTRGDRRYCVMYSALQEPYHLINAGLTEAWFVEFNDYLRNRKGFSHIAYYLSTYKIDDKFNPAKTCVRAPSSSSQSEVDENSISYIQVAIREAIQEGAYGFRKGWVCFQRATALFPGKVNRNRVNEELKELGYIPNVLLSDNGWSDNPLVEEGGKRVKLYCNNNVLLATKSMKRGEIVSKYQQDQV